MRSNAKMMTMSMGARVTNRHPNLRLAVAVAAAVVAAMTVIRAIARMKMDVMRMWAIIQSTSQTGESTLLGAIDHHGLTFVLVLATPQPRACT